MVLDYFNSNESRRTNNEAGAECPWWTRTRYGGWCAVGYTGGIITNVTTDAKYGVRPAFTISNTSKIKQIYNEELNKEIYVFSYTKVQFMKLCKTNLHNLENVV